MVPFFITTLAISVVGMFAIIGVKRWELTTGRVLAAQIRPMVANFLEGGVGWIAHRIPATLRQITWRLYRLLRLIAHRLVARGILLVEHGLERVLHMLRHTTQTPLHEGESASIFLREVAEHKKKLLKSSRASQKVVNQ